MNVFSKEFNKQLQLDVLVSGLTEITQDYVRQFDEAYKFTYVVIPEGVKSIGRSAFAYCVNLKHIRLPKSLTSIGAYAFWSCDRLNKVTIPASVKSIGKCAFSDCNSLICVTFNGKTYDDVRSMDGYPWDLSTLKINVEVVGKITFENKTFNNDCSMEAYSWDFLSEENDLFSEENDVQFV